MKLLYPEKILMGGCGGSLPGKVLSPACWFISGLDLFPWISHLSMMFFPSENIILYNTIVLRNASEVLWKNCKSVPAERCGRNTAWPGELIPLRAHLAWGWCCAFGQAVSSGTVQVKHLSGPLLSVTGGGLRGLWYFNVLSVSSFQCCFFSGSVTAFKHSMIFSVFLFYILFILA